MLLRKDGSYYVIGGVGFKDNFLLEVKVRKDRSLSKLLF